jgi:hypothetical protein
MGHKWGQIGGGQVFIFSVLHNNPIPTPTLPLKGRGISHFKGRKIF